VIGAEWWVWVPALAGVLFLVAFTLWALFGLWADY